MDNNYLIVLSIFVGVTAIAFVGQLVAMIIIAMTARRLEARIAGLIPEIQHVVGISRRTLEKAEGHIDRIGAASATIVETTKTQVGKIDELLNDITARAKVQVERADMLIDDVTARAKVQVQRAEMVLDDAMGRTQETVSILQRTILRPVREINGVLSGVRTGLAHLGRSSRPTVDHATSDEEMFI